MPRFRPFLEVGRDYFEDSLRCLSEFGVFENAITERHPRFRDDKRDFANSYVFSFLEAFVAEVALKGEQWSPDAPSFDTCLNSLATVIEAESREVACCRNVSHLTTGNGEPLDFEDVTVVPITTHSREISRAIACVIPHAQTAYSHQSLLDGWGPPNSIVVARDHSPEVFDSAKTISSRIERFLFAVRLLYAGTCCSLYEIQGETSLVRLFTPTLERFRGSTGLLSPTSKLRRTTRLEPSDIGRVTTLVEAITKAEGEPQGILLTPFGIAKHKFLMSYHAHAWYEQLVDLATAFEAVLSGTARTDIQLRLKTRASALLATENDPADAIFKDIGILYELRSQLIHGSALSEKRATKGVKSITTVPDNIMPGVAFAYAIDRLRDLVRRALLARICLAICEPPLWGLNQDKNVDARLADTSNRELWHSKWRDVLRSFNALESSERSRTAVATITDERTLLAVAGIGIEVAASSRADIRANYCISRN